MSTRDAEEHTLSLFAGLETERLGDWVLRTVPVLEGRLVKRANSCLAIGDPGMDPTEAARRVRAFYTDRDRPVLAQVESGSDVDSALSAAGWTAVPGGDADFLLASLSRALRSCNAMTPTPTTPRYRESGAGRVRVEIGDGVAGGEAALDGDWLGLHDLKVVRGPPTAGAGHAGARRAPGVGRRAGRDDGVAARRGRQRPGAGALRAGRLPRPTTPAATCAGTPDAPA